MVFFEGGPTRCACVNCVMMLMGSKSKVYVEDQEIGRAQAVVSLVWRV